ncbi:MAG TPA: preprotein translocase subunit SecG [Candidatus Acidoferrales bacterium]|jgi:protein translocase SecG subunit|nr:preprotein translocase subunit SecG [Candidatus Acidoferrales bacterium]
MSLIVYVLVGLLIINAGFLTLLILAQPPKKDSGAGLAFGGGTADALFGAGSGTALSKITKWATVVFIVLAVILGMMETRMHQGNRSDFESGVEQQQQMQGAPQPRVAPQPANTPPPSAPAVAPAMPLYSATNAAPSAPAGGK